MKICVAQTRAVKGDIPRNIDNHKKLIDLAVSSGAAVVIFPELSLTGYEPTLAKELATRQDDSRLDVFQQISDVKQVTIGVGVPIKNNSGITISMILFQPHKARRMYSKKYLHADEEPFFVSGENFASLNVNQSDIALAICYELSIPEHSETAFKSGAKIYIASAVKSVRGIDKARKELADIARKYSMTVLFSNSVGQADDFECAGKTSVWNSEGVLVGQLDDVSEGVLMIDMETQELVEKIL